MVMPPAGGPDAVVDVPKVGQVVFMGTQLIRGVVRYVGQTDFAAGDWVGLELDDALGKHDGTVKDKSYFKCEHGRGIFVRPAHVAAAGPDGLPLRIPQEPRMLKTFSDASQATVNTDTPPAKERLGLKAQTEARPKVCKKKKKAAGVKANRSAEVSSPCRAHLDSSEEAQQKRTAFWQGVRHTKSLHEALSQAVEERDVQQLETALRLAQESGITDEHLDGARRVLKEERARLSLAEAREDRDFDKLQRAIEEAEALAVPKDSQLHTELDGAHRLLNFEVSRRVGGVSDDIERLTQLVREAEARATAAEHRADEAERRRHEAPTHMDEGVEAALIEGLAAKLEERVLSRLQQHTNGVVAEAVTESSKRFNIVAEEVRRLVTDVLRKHRERVAGEAASQAAGDEAAGAASMDGTCRREEFRRSVLADAW